MDENDDCEMGERAPSKAQSASPAPLRVAEKDASQTWSKASNEGVRFGDTKSEASKGKSPREGVRFAPSNDEDRGHHSREEKSSGSSNPNSSSRGASFGNGALDGSKDGPGEQPDVRLPSFRKYMPFLSSRGGATSPKADSGTPQSTRAETPRSTKSEAPNATKPDSPAARMRKTLGNILSPNSRTSTGARPEKRKTLASLAHNFTQSKEHREGEARSPGVSPTEEMLRREPTARIFKKRARSASRGPRRGRDRFRGIGAFFSNSAARHAPRPPGAAQEEETIPPTNTMNKRFLAVMRSKRVLSRSPVRGDSRAGEFLSTPVHKARSADDERAH
jgi:hypothetical protein